MPSTSLTAPGLIQNRAHFLILVGVIDKLLEAYRQPVLPGLEQKIYTLRNRLRLEEKYGNLLGKHLLCALHLLLALYKGPPDEYVGVQHSQMYTCFIDHLEKAYLSEEYRQGGPLAQFLQQLAYFSFTVSLHTYALKAVPSFDKSQGGAFFASLNQARGHLNFDFNPLKTNNLAQHLWAATYDVGGREKSIQCLRFGTPTEEAARTEPKVIPFMRLFLDYCKRTGKRVVSFQHQNPASKSPGKGDESARLNKMFELEKQYRENFFVFGFPMDGDFFNQAEEYGSEIVATGVFQKQFLDHIFDAAGQITLPDCFPHTEVAEIKEVVRDVHTNFFGSKGELTIAERKIYQILTYIYLEEYFILALDADIYHSQCKDAVDRAMVILALTHYLHLLRTGEEDDLIKLKDFEALIHFPGIAAKGLRMNGGRHALLTEVLKHLQGLSGDQKKQIRDYRLTVKGQSCGFKESAFERKPYQDSLGKLPNEAADVVEFARLLELEGRGIWEARLPRFATNYYAKVGEQEVQLKQFERDQDRQVVFVNGEKIEASQIKGEILRLAKGDKALADRIKGLTTQTPTKDVNFILSDRYDNPGLGRVCAPAKLGSLRETYFVDLTQKEGGVNMDIYASYNITNTNSDPTSASSIIAWVPTRLRINVSDGSADATLHWIPSCDEPPPESPFDLKAFF